MTLVRRWPKDARRSATKSRSATSAAWPLSLDDSNRRRIAAAVARRAARERLVLALLLYERMRPLEVAEALGVSLREVERTYDAMIADVRRQVARRRRTLAERARTNSTGTRLRKAA